MKSFEMFYRPLTGNNDPSLGKIPVVVNKKRSFFGIVTNFQWEKGIVLRLGEYSREVGAGIFFIIPFIESVYVVSTRTTPVDIPKQDIMTRDNVSVYVNGVAYFHVTDPKKVLMNVRDPGYAISRYAQTALREVIGTMSLDEVLSERTKIAERIEKIVDKMAHTWGIDIESIKIQDIVLPDTMKRAMARQAEAEREKRGLIVKSKGELESAKNFVNAAKNLQKSKGSMYLRTLSTLADISSDKSSKKNIYVIPPEILDFVKNIGNIAKGKK